MNEALLRTWNFVWIWRKILERFLTTKIFFVFSAQDLQTVRNMKVSFQIASDLRNLEKGIFVMHVYLSSRDGDGCRKTQRSTGPMWSMLETDLVTNKLANRRRKRII